MGERPPGQQLRISRICSVLAWLLVFPMFSVDLRDHAGLTVAEGANIDASAILRLSWVGLVALTLFFSVLARLVRHSPSPAGTVSGTLRHWLAVVLLITLATVGANTPADMRGWYFAFELSVVVLATLFVARELRSRLTTDEFAIYLARLFLGSFLLGVAAVFAVGMVLPEAAFMYAGGRGARLGGSIYHPNTLALGALVALVSARLLRTAGWLSRPGFAFSVLVMSLALLGTRSRSALALFVLAVLILVVGDVSRRMGAPARMAAIAFGIFIASTFGILGVDAPEAGYEDGFLANQDRAKLYSIAVEGIAAHPFIGVGYESGVRRYFAENRGGMEHWAPRHAHNLFLDIFLSRGLLLGLPFALLVAIAILKSIRVLFGGGAHQIDVQIALILLMIIAHGMVESSIAGRVKEFTTVSFILTLVYVWHTRQRRVPLDGTAVSAHEPTVSIN
jgi:O-antigen ligase